MALSFFRKDVKYSRIEKHDHAGAYDSDAESVDGLREPRGMLAARTKLWLMISWTITVLLAMTNLLMWQHINDNKLKDPVFSPASSAVRYHQIVTESGLGKDLTPYQGAPSEENDKLWVDLYNNGMTSIPRDQAAMLANRTVPIPADPDHYIVTLDVFHNLHCLNKIRQNVWLTANGETPPKYGPMGIVHMDHCIDAIRQSLMCSSDITPRPYGWSRSQNASLPVNHILKTCRDFDAIRDWAKDHETKHFDQMIFTEDPLGNVYTVYDIDG